MNSNNYIRKVDELGRIVIPKEIRNKLKIQDNENILLKIDNEKLVISKYSYLNNYTSFINEICNALTEIYRINIEIKDREKILFSNIKTETNIQKEDIIKDSIIIGSIKIENANDKNLIKFLSRIITLYISNCC